MGVRCADRSNEREGLRRSRGGVEEEKKKKVEEEEEEEKVGREGGREGG